METLSSNNEFIINIHFLKMLLALEAKNVKIGDYRKSITFDIHKNNIDIIRHNKEFNRYLGFYKYDISIFGNTNSNIVTIEISFYEATLSIKRLSSVPFM